MKNRQKLFMTTFCIIATLYACETTVFASVEFEQRENDDFSFHSALNWSKKKKIVSN